MSRILVIAAHPDDEVLGMGGTIALHAAERGDPVRIVCVTDGSSTQYPGDAEIRAQKEGEARAAAAELGVTDYVHLDLPDMRLDTLAHVEVNRVVEEQIARLRARGRLHRAPRREPRPPRALRLGRGRDAARPGPGRERVLTYAPTSSTEWTPAAVNWFVPNWFVDITATLERKLASFAHYATEGRTIRIRAASRRFAPRRRSTARAAAARRRSRSCSCAGSSRSLSPREARL